MLRRDWEFLFTQLKSSWAVAEYFHRVADEAVELGAEPARYYDLALADADAAPEELDAALMLPGQKLVSTPLLPTAPVGTTDQAAHEMIRVVLEDIATTRLHRTLEEDRLRTLAGLDRLPVGQRAEAGRFLLAAMAEVAEVADQGIAWRLRSLRGNAGTVHLGCGACSRPHDPDIQEFFGCWVQLRHFDLVEITRDYDTITVGVLLTPRRGYGRPWDTTVGTVTGKLQFEPQELQALRELWPLEWQLAA